MYNDNEYNDMIRIEDDKESLRLATVEYDRMSDFYEPFIYLDRARINNRWQAMTRYWPGSTAEDAKFKYEHMLSYQKNACAICEYRPTGGKNLVVDHCHTTGKVRGLLCNSCNTQLVAALDKDARMLNAGLKYLGRL